MRLLLLCFAASWLAIALQVHAADPQPQYKHEEIRIPAARSEEKKRDAVSSALGLAYVEQGAAAWTGARRCVSCHTNGSYLQIRPLLTKSLGKPSAEIRQFFVQELNKYRATAKKDVKRLLGGVRPTQLAYIANGLAAWDKHVSGKLSAETRQALELMLQVQDKNGSWGNTDCWPPFESSAYQGTTVAALAMATAPGWLENLKDKKAKAGVEKLKAYLSKTKPPHEYGRLLLLWAASHFQGLIDEKKKQELVESVVRLQLKDGGWSIRTFAKPEQWGNGGRAKKLKAEKDRKDPASDGHMTGLAILVLRDAGIPASDERIQAGVTWLLANQRASGRWWTRSLNKDTFHFITYSGTLYSLAALDKCDALPPLK